MVEASSKLLVRRLVGVGYAEKFRDHNVALDELIAL